MPTPPKPCLEHRCPEYAVPGGARCKAHGGNATPSGKITQTHRWRKLRHELIAERPWVCDTRRQPIADESLIEVHHVKPVSRGGAPFDPANLVLTCRPCNRQQGGRRFPKRRNTGMNAPWMLDADTQR